MIDMIFGLTLVVIIWAVVINNSLKAIEKELRKLNAPRD